jgi:tRNA (guanine37-N1)-methyltransferase
MPWAATILTLYPEMFPGAAWGEHGGRALAEGRWTCEAVQIRDYATGPPPFGRRYPPRGRGRGW